MPLRAIPLEGRLDCWGGSFDVADLLLASCDDGKTGRLEIQTGDVQKTVFVEKGKIAFASSTSPDDRLGVYLLKRNLLRLSDLRRLSLQVRPGVRLGTLLVRESLLDPDALVRSVVGQVEAIIHDLFLWTHADYRILERAPSKEESIRLRIPTARLIVDGIQRVESWRRIACGVGSLEESFVTLAGNEDSIRSVDLDTASLELLAKLGHPHTAEQLCDSTDLADIDVCRRLWAFRVLGWVAPASSDAGKPDTSVLDSDLEGLGMILGDQPLKPE